MYILLQSRLDKFLTGLLQYLAKINIALVGRKKIYKIPN